MLNKFLQSKCRKYITPINLSELSGKKIVVDISIYLYKFLSENALLENLYLMISIFRENKIIPIFIFDGKPPVEKNDTIAFRKRIKNGYSQHCYLLRMASCCKHGSHFSKHKNNYNLRNRSKLWGKPKRFIKTSRCLRSQ